MRASMMHSTRYFHFCLFMFDLDLYDLPVDEGNL